MDQTKIKGPIPLEEFFKGISVDDEVLVLFHGKPLSGLIKKIEADHSLIKLGISIDGASDITLEARKSSGQFRFIGKKGEMLISAELEGYYIIITPQ